VQPWIHSTPGRDRVTRALLCLTLALAASWTTASAQDPNACDEPGDAPDLVTGNLDSVARMGGLDGVTAYAIGATTCNLGSCWADWFFDTPAHPVFAQNLFRLKDGRFEQIGQSWVAHRLYALSAAYCEPGCLPTNGEHLGTHCSTSNSANATASQGRLGPRSEVNASTGEIVYPFTGMGSTGSHIYKRLQVENADLDPASNPGALYFIEGQQVAQDDATAGRGENNASYRQVTVAGTAGSFDLLVTGTTRTQEPAIHAWTAHDPSVVLESVDLPDDGRFLVGSKATALGAGRWRYEYAVHNLNSHRAAASFSVPIPWDAVVTDIGFHDVDYHSGEPFDGTDWTPTVGTVPAPHVAWETASFEENPDANALRWGTLYNFRFEVAAAPTAGAVSLGLFRPGTPGAVAVPALVPQPCDADATCDPGEHACNCASDCGDPAGAEYECADGFDDDCDGDLDCEDGDCCGSPACSLDDHDGDTHLACEDCDDGHGGIWATPGEVTGLTLDRAPGNRAILLWNPPAEPGAITVAYQAIRSGDPSDFVTGVVCLSVLDPLATTAVDGESPGPGGLFHYLVRATNGCPDGVGPVGEGSNGSIRAAGDCPWSMASPAAQVSYSRRQSSGLTNFFQTTRALKP